MVTHHYFPVVTSNWFAWLIISYTVSQPTSPLLLVVYHEKNIDLSLFSSSNWFAWLIISCSSTIFLSTLTCCIPWALIVGDCGFTFSEGQAACVFYTIHLLSSMIHHRLIPLINLGIRSNRRRVIVKQRIYRTLVFTRSWRWCCNW